MIFTNQCTGINADDVSKKFSKKIGLKSLATKPSDAINIALDNFWEQEHGSNGSTKQKEPYNFRVTEINRVVDGDTIDVTIDLGFDLYKKERVRVAGVDTPEKREQEIWKKKHWD